MDIFLVPVAPDRYELYCEVEDHPPAEVGGRGRWRQRAVQAFHRAVTWIESERRRRLELAATAPRTRWQHLRDRVLAWLAERIAEQRLLWYLRSKSDVTARHPDDCLEADAAAVVRKSLRDDSRRHVIWAVLHLAGYLVSLPLSALPGPNLPAYFFSFRAFGHGLSWLGARHGLRAVRWRYEPCEALTDLRRMPSLAGAARVTLAHDVATRLQLRHLDTFVERMTLGGP
jgi:hypothetical protein